MIADMAAKYRRAEAVDAVGAKRQRASDIKATVGRNLRWARELVDDNRSRLAAGFGQHHTIWQKWEEGRNYPDPARMVEFCDTYGFTMDWLYRSSLDGVDEALKRRLIALHPELVLGSDAAAAAAPVHEGDPAPPRAPRQPELVGTPAGSPSGAAGRRGPPHTPSGIPGKGQTPPKK